MPRNAGGSGDAPDVDAVGEREPSAFGEREPIRVNVEPSSRPVIEAPPKMRKEVPNSSPPNAKEWQDFLGRVVIRAGTNALLVFMLGDMELTPQEFEDIKLTPEDLNEMSAPLASLATKSKLAQKHGRKIIAAGDSWEAVLSMALWVRKVRRIARRHKNTDTPKRSRVVSGTVIGSNGDAFNEPVRPDAEQESRPGSDGGFPFIYNPGTG